MRSEWETPTVFARRIGLVPRQRSGTSPAALAAMSLSWDDVLALAVSRYWKFCGRAGVGR